MGKKYAFRYIVVGGGPAGCAAATALAKAKKSVALIEARFFGGSDLNTRDVPYASALHTAHIFHSAKTFPEFNESNLSVNLTAMLNQRIKAILSSGGNDPKPLEDAGVSCIRGYATLLDAHTVSVGDKQFTADHFILATGARINPGNIAGIDTVKVLTPETALNLRYLPESALVIGGGATGVEIAEYYAKLGTKVVLLEEKPRILPREDREVSLAISTHLSNELGVIVFPGCKATALENYQDQKQVIFTQDGIEKAIIVETVILATGSRPVLNYGLENAKVKYNASGIIVDKNLTTSAKNIYAIGDCTASSRESSTDRATYEGLYLVSNLTGKNKSILNYNGFIRQVKTTPAVATVGMNELDLAAKKIVAKKVLVPLSETASSKTDHAKIGFVKLFTDPTNHILGATIVAPYADLMIEEIALAMRHHLSALELAATPHAINSLNYAVKLAAKKVLTTKKAKIKNPKAKKTKAKKVNAKKPTLKKAKSPKAAKPPKAPKSPKTQKPRH